MKKQILIAGILAALLLSSCGNLQSTAQGKQETIEQQAADIEKQFSDAALYRQIVMIPDPEVGNIIAVTVKQKPDAKLIENWSYTHAPVTAKRKGIRLKLSSVGSWKKDSEQFESQNGMNYFSLKQIPWQSINTWIDKATAEIKKLGVEVPELDSITIMDYGSGLIVLIRMKTMGGGSFINYEFNMQGELIKTYN